MSAPKTPRRMAVLLTAAGLLALSTPSAAELRVFVTNEKSDDVTVIEAASGRVLATIPVGKRPRGITVQGAHRRGQLGGQETQKRQRREHEQAGQAQGRQPA